MEAETLLPWQPLALKAKAKAARKAESAPSADPRSVATGRAAHAVARVGEGARASERRDAVRGI